MIASVKLYTLPYSEIKTYLWALLFIACNTILPQVSHLIPQGGIIFAPLSLVILTVSYKLGWKVGLLTAVATPIVNHLIFGLPAWDVLQVMMLKLSILALTAGLTAQHFRTVSLPLLVAVVLSSELLGGAGEWLLTGSIAATVADFTTGWPGLLLQIIGAYLIVRFTK